ncbi:MAG: hypothetical protein RBR16_10010 [Syntrophus sp. (in: bacteria)]|nr:hypothetical protein [Syntrophus sp. (in: bacteria)]
MKKTGAAVNEALQLPFQDAQHTLDDSVPDISEIQKGGLLYGLRAERLMLCNAAGLAEEASVVAMDRKKNVAGNVSGGFSCDSVTKDRAALTPAFGERGAARFLVNLLQTGSLFSA